MPNFRPSTLAPRLSLFAALFVLAACSQGPALQQEVAETLNRGRNRPIVEQTSDAPSSCTTLYASGSANAALTNAVIDPGLRYGATGTLILSFNSDDALANAVSLITTRLGIRQGRGLGVFDNLPMLALEAPISRTLITTLTTLLQPLGLLSIYQDAPLEYFLSDSADFVGAPAARESFGVTGKGVGVAVLDSGVDGLQGDFANMVQNVKIVAPLVNVGVGGYVTVEMDNTDTTSGHGTHVASTIGGTGERSDGRYTGIAPEAQLVGIGAGDALFILYALQGFDYATDPDNREAHNIRIISNSWGTSGDFAPFHPINIASKRAYDLDMIVAFAAGNAGPGANTLNPYSASPCVISVAAGDKSGRLADFSSRGIPGDALVRPDITAPGVQIIAARAATGAVTPPFTGDLEYGAFYARISGTSMATPHISGIAALMLEANPGLNLDGVLGFLTDTARPMFYLEEAESGLDPEQVKVKRREPWEVGAGYVDAFAAIKAAAASSGGRVTIDTEALDNWSGTVGTAVRVPTVGDLVLAEDSYDLAVPAGASALRIAVDWGNPGYDLDLYVYDPSGQAVASSAQAATATEAVAIPNPRAGTYRVVLEGYLNGPVDYQGEAEIDTVR